MLRMILLYLREVATGNALRILTAELVISVVVGVLYFYGALTNVSGRQVLLEPFASRVLTFAGVALSACLTAITMAIQRIDVKFSEYLASQPPSSLVSFDRILFKLSWAAVVNWAILFFGTGVLLLSPQNAAMFDSNLEIGWKAAIAFLLSLFVYSIMLLLTAILMIAVIGMQYAHSRFIVLPRQDRSERFD